MQAKFISIKVDDLRCGESRRYLVIAPDGTSGIGMALEPMSFHVTCGNLINLVQHA